MLSELFEDYGFYLEITFVFSAVDEFRITAVICAVTTAPCRHAEQNAEKQYGCSYELSPSHTLIPPAVSLLYRYR